jgi:hypothetical protein
LATPKKIIIFFLKLGIGIVSFWIIYSRLIQIPHLKEQVILIFQSPAMYLVMTGALLLMPVNWGIESFKWKLITSNTQKISFKTALKSIFSGICVGNIAPGRAMEFLAKIYFFTPENRPDATVLHFVNGMFQMLITVTVGLIAVSFKLQRTETESNFIYYIIIGGILLVIFFCWAILNVSVIQQKLKHFRWFKVKETSKLDFSKSLILRLVSLSLIRYLVFTSQFFLIFNSLSPQINVLETVASIAAYFMLTSLVPMVSFIEPAIRAAIALFVFHSGESTVLIVLSSTFVWIINVVIPSIIGYIIILKEKIDFRSARAR